MKNYINSDKLSLNKYSCESSHNYPCLDYASAISHRYSIRRKSPAGAYWWHGFNQADAMVKFISSHVYDGNEIHEIIGNCSEDIRHLLFFDIDANTELFENTKLTFNIKNVPVEKLFNKVESVSEYRFLFESSTFFFRSSDDF